MPTRKNNKKHEQEQRKVLYPEVKAFVCIGEDAITVEQCRDMLGCTEDEKVAKEAGVDQPLFVEGPLMDGRRKGKTIYCLNNVRNRPLYMSTVEALVQEHLMKRWRFNGEPIIQGKTGTIENGQHTLVSVLLAEQDRIGPNKGRWEDNWPNEVTMEKMVVRGVDETDDVINTMDTCKPRTLADVIYRSECFASMDSAARRTVSRMTDYAVRLLWHRTGAGLDAFAPRRTHSEALDFIGRHPRLLRAVKHIHEEDSERAVSKYLSPGYASGMLFMMGSSSSDGDDYRNAEPPSEKKLSWENWDKACEFWVLLGSGSPKFKEVRYALGSLYGQDVDVEPSLKEKLSVLAKAWHAFLEGGSITESDLKLKFTRDSDGVRHLTEVTPVGGIDLGEPSQEDKKDMDADKKETDGDKPPYEPTREEIEKGKVEQRELQKKKLLEDRVKRKERDKNKKKEEASA